MWLILSILMTAQAQPSSSIIPEIDKLDPILKELKLSRFKGKTGTRTVKIAILDNGFNGHEAEIGRTLPQKTYYYRGAESAADRIEQPSFHGTFMAQLVARIIKESKVPIDYELHLYNSYGYTKFAHAVDEVIKNSMDLVLYSQVWEYGGNGDGKGFINALVDKAMDSGIVWINAAGNFGRTTVLKPVRTGSDGEWVVFKTVKGKDVDRVTGDCKPPPKEKNCILRVVLSWNDFTDHPQGGTDKDLDLYVSFGKKKETIVSDRTQVRVKDSSVGETASLFPRELIETKVPKGKFEIRVKVKSQNFSPNRDTLRITASGGGISLVDPTTDETLLPPADNPRVIVVGASDDDKTSRSISHYKPDVSFKSMVKLKDGSLPFSTSNSAAVATALATLHLATGVEKDRDQILRALREVGKSPKIPPPLPVRKPDLTKQEVAAAPEVKPQPPAPSEKEDKIVPPINMDAKPVPQPKPTPPSVTKPPVSAPETKPKTERDYAEVPKPKVTKPKPEMKKSPKVAAPGPAIKPPAKTRLAQLPPQPGPSLPQDGYVPPGQPPAPIRFGPPGQCFPRRPVPHLYPVACQVVCQPGTFSVQTRTGTGVIVPAPLAARLRLPFAPGVRVFATPQGFIPMAVGPEFVPPPDYYEIFIASAATQLCH